MALEKWLIDSVEDPTYLETTYIWFEFENTTGLVERINNNDVLHYLEVVIHIKHPDWTRGYHIAPVNKGDDRTLIDFPFNVPTMYLIFQDPDWVLPANVDITITQRRPASTTTTTTIRG